MYWWHKESFIPQDNLFLGSLNMRLGGTTCECDAIYTADLNHTLIISISCEHTCIYLKRDRENSIHFNNVNIFIEQLRLRIKFSEIFVYVITIYKRCIYFHGSKVILAKFLLLILLVISLFLIFHINHHVNISTMQNCLCFGLSWCYSFIIFPV